MAGAALPERLVGVEHEFVVAREHRLDFGRMIGGLGLRPQHLDPGDVNACRLRSGAVVTSDGREAELALPPIASTTGFAATIDGSAAIARAELRTLLGGETSITGYSTHISVSCISPERVALRYLSTFAPALALLLDRADSPGLLVRPRAGRLELCGEYAHGSALRAAAAFACASVAACEEKVVPPSVGLRPQLDDHRYGWYIDRRAYGVDLYAGGRGTRLRLRDGSPTTAQDHLAACWLLVRDLLAENDAAPLDAMVSGSTPIPCEHSDPEDEPECVEADQDVFGRIAGTHSGSGFELAPVMATWDVTVFVAVHESRDRHAFACVPRAHFEPFLAGEVDPWIASYLRRPPRGRKLRRHSQTLELGMWDELGPRRRLLPVERGAEYRRRRRVIAAHLLTPRELRPRRGLRGWMRELALVT